MSDDPRRGYRGLVLDADDPQALVLDDAGADEVDLPEEEPAPEYAEWLRRNPGKR